MQWDMEKKSAVIVVEEQEKKVSLKKPPAFELMSDKNQHKRTG
jgi:hypothetical protein